MPGGSQYTAPKTSQHTCFSLLSAILKTKLDELFFLSALENRIFHENSGHRDTLETYYEEGSVP